MFLPARVQWCRILSKSIGQVEIWLKDGVGSRQGLSLESYKKKMEFLWLWWCNQLKERNENQYLLEERNEKQYLTWKNRATVSKKIDIILNIISRAIFILKLFKIQSTFLFNYILTSPIMLKHLSTSFWQSSLTLHENGTKKQSNSRFCTKNSRVIKFSIWKYPILVSSHRNYTNSIFSAFYDLLFGRQLSSKLIFNKFYRLLLMMFMCLLLLT